MFQNKWFYLFCISMLPIVELRGSIPAGAAMGLSFWPVYLTCVLGNLLPVPFLILFAKKILEFLSTLPRIGGFFQKIIRRADQKAAEIGHYEKWGLFLFVAIRCRAPAPGPVHWWRRCCGCVSGRRSWSSRSGYWPSDSSPAGSPMGCLPRWHNTIIYINGEDPLLSQRVFSV